jgi:hypothetical protein
MPIPADIAAVIWTNAVRTLATGTPDAPTTPETWIAKAIWEYATRELTGAPPVGKPLFCEVGPMVFVGGPVASRACVGGVDSAMVATGGASAAQVVRGDFRE